MVPGMIQTVDRNAPLTVVAFSGIAPQNHVYEWMTALSDLPVNVIGVQDPHETWWGDCMDEALAALRDALGSKRWVALGASAGGYGAVLFGTTLCADRIVTFVPQTARGATKRALGDARWASYCARTQPGDLADWGAGVEVHIGDDPLDVMHAERLRGARIMRHPAIGHDLPHVLKRERRLAPILEDLAGVAA